MYQNIDDNYDNPPTPNMYPNLNLNNPTECTSNTQSLNTIYDKTTQQKQIEKKVNLRVLPTLIGLYFFTILARNNVSNAAEQMEVDLRLTPDQYSTAVGVFFITYVSCQIPGNIVHKKVGRPAITFGVVLSSMGIFCCCFMLAKNLMGLVILRLFVGLAEACVYPGILYFITIWYTSEQRPRAIASVGTASGLAGGLAGILAFGLLRMDYFGLKGWQWLFLVEGLPAVIFGIVIMLTLPASPTNCTFLTEEEKFLIVSNQEQVKDTGIQLSHMTTILKNWRLWVMGLAFSGTSSVLYGINYFLPQLIANFGYSELASELLTSPASVFGSMAAFFVATMVKRYNGKTELFALAACLVATLNYGLFAACILFGHGILRYFALVFANMTSTIWYSPMLAWASSEAKGSPAQIAMGIALVNSLGNLGGIIGPKIMSHAVTQFGSFGIGILILCFVHVFSFILVAFLYFTNRKPKVHIGSPFLQPSVNITIEDTETTHLLGK